MENNELAVDPSLVSGTEAMIASLSAEKASEPVNQQQQVSEPEVTIPDKFKGKSLQDVIKSYQELESQLGKQGSELGELRKVADQFIRENSPTRRQPEADVDFISEPEKAVKQVVHEELAPIQDEVLEFRQMKMDQKLSTAHPDYKQIYATEDFQKWVLESPVRIELFARADRNYDATAGVELFSMYKAMTKKADNPVRNEQLRASTMETAGTTESAPKKIYRRIDLINLKLNDPRRYEALNDEIMRAYAEGRVR